MNGTVFCDGFVMHPSGRKLKIVDEIRPGMTDAVTRERLAKERERLAEIAEAYETGLQNNLDAAHAGLIDSYLKQGMVTEAEEYLARVAANETRFGMSEKGVAVSGLLVAKHRESADLQAGAAASLSGVLAAGSEDLYSGGDKYLTSKMDEAAAREVARLADAAARDETGKTARQLRMFQSLWETRRGAMLALEKAETQQLLKEFHEKGMLQGEGLVYAGMELAKMEPSPVRDAVAQVYARQRTAEDRELNANPAVKAARRGRVLDFMRRIDYQDPARRTVEIGNQSYNLDDAKEFSAAMLAGGFSAGERAEIQLYRQGGRKNVRVAAKILAETLNRMNGYEPDPASGKVYFTEQTVLRQAPGLIDVVLDTVGMNPEHGDPEKKADRAAIEQELLKRLSVMNATERALLGTAKVNVGEYLGRGVAKDGTLKVGPDGVPEFTFDGFRKLGTEPEELRREAQYLEDCRALREGRESETVWREEGEALAKGRGLVPGRQMTRTVYRPKAAQDEIDAETAKRRPERAKRAKEYVEDFNLVRDQQDLIGEF